MYKGIFGELAPKFVYDLGGENEQTVNLSFWEDSKDEPEERELVHEGEGKPALRIIKDLGDYWEFEGLIHLFMYGSLTEQRSKFEEIWQFNKKNVCLWRHRDGEPFKDSEGNNALFYLKVTAMHRDKLDYRDLLLLNFRSLGEVEPSDGSVIAPTIDEILMF